VYSKIGRPLDSRRILEGRESFISCTNHGYLEAIDLGARHYQVGDTEGDFVFGTTYEMELRCDPEGRLLAFRNGKEVARVIAGPRTEGGIYLFLHSEFSLASSASRSRASPSPRRCAPCATRRPRPSRSGAEQGAGGAFVGAGDVGRQAARGASAIPFRIFQRHLRQSSASPCSCSSG
jgi:hypothetical protein